MSQLGQAPSPLLAALGGMGGQPQQPMGGMMGQPQMPPGVAETLQQPLGDNLALLFQLRSMPGFQDQFDPFATYNPPMGQPSQPPQMSPLQPSPTALGENHALPF